MLYSEQGARKPRHNYPKTWGGSNDIEAWVRYCLGEFQSSLTAVQIIGRNRAVSAGTAEDIWLGPTAGYVFQTAAVALEVVSSSVNDAAAGTGARTVRIWGLDANLLQVIQDVTLNGTTAVAVTTNLQYVLGFEVLTAGSGLVNAGNIDVRVDSGDVVQSQIGTSRGRAETGVFTVPADCSLVLVPGGTFAAGIATTFVDPANVELQHRAPGGAWQTDFQGRLSAAGGRTVTMPPTPFAYEEGTEIIARFLDAGATTAGLEVICNIPAVLIARHNRTLPGTADAT